MVARLNRVAQGLDRGHEFPRVGGAGAAAGTLPTLLGRPVQRLSKEALGNDQAVLIVLAIIITRRDRTFIPLPQWGGKCVHHGRNARRGRISGRWTILILLFFLFFFLFFLFFLFQTRRSRPISSSLRPRHWDNTQQ